jgi:hypothetical protein
MNKFALYSILAFFLALCVASFVFTDNSPLSYTVKTPLILGTLALGYGIYLKKWEK